MQESVWDVGLGHKYLFALPRKWIWNIPGRAFRLYPDECVPSWRRIVLITHRCCLFVENHLLDFRTIKGIQREKDFPVWCSLPLLTKHLTLSISCNPSKWLTDSLKWLETCRITLLVGPRDSRKRHRWKVLSSHSKRTSDSWWVKSSAAVNKCPS